MLEAKIESQPFNENWGFIYDHYDELLEKYPEHWIAVVDKKVVAADLDPRQLVSDLREIGPLKDPGSAVVEQMTSQESYCIHAL